ncbi:MAG: lipopolysaccharide biosynthesis protein [Micromonosporaceae bacterium]
MAAVELAPPPTAPPSGLGGAARGGALNLAGAAYAAVAGFAVAALVARGLTPDQAGVFFTATTVFLVGAVVCKLGTPTGLVYWLARLRTQGRPGLVRRCLSIALRPVVIAAVALGIAGFLAAPWLAGSVGALFADQLRILAVMLPLAAVGDAVLAATRGYRTMRPTVVIDKLVRPTLQLLGVGATVLLAASVPWYTAAWAAPWAITAVLAWLALRPLLPPPRPANPTRPPDPTPSGPARPDEPPGALAAPGEPGFWGFTWPRGVANVLQLALQRLDVVLVAALAGFAPAAVYAVATRFTVVGQLGNAAIGTASEPRLAEALTRGDDATAKQLYTYATAWLVLAAWPVYLLTATFAPLYLGLFGPAYATGEATAVVLLLCGAMLVASGCGTVDTVLAMTGRTTWNLGNVSAALVVNVGLNLLLLPRLGILGAGIAWTAATITKNLLPLGQLAVRRGLHPYGWATAVAAGLAVGCFGVLPLLFRLVLGPSAPALLAGAGAGAVCYLAGLWRLRGPLRLDSFLSREAPS